MKTIMLAAAAALALGVGTGSAYAGDGDGPVPNTAFTELPGVIAQAPVQTQRNVAANQQGGGTAAFITGHSGAVSLFPPNSNQGANS